MKGVHRLSLAPRERAVLVLGAIALVLILGTARGVPAWLAWVRNARASAQEMTHAVWRTESLIRSERAASDSLSARNERLQLLERELLDGDSPAVAAASLAGLVSDAAASSGVELGTVQLRADSSSTTAFIRVSVRADATGDVRGLMEFLAELERMTLLAVRELSISASDLVAPADRAEILRSELVVEGLARRKTLSSENAK
ncbi:MAG: type II secretion system protein GspM [Gemmatimonadaceae bacterium]